MNKYTRIILASGSPRRRELLGRIGLEYEVIVSEVDEDIDETIPQKVVEELSYRKAMAVAHSLPENYYKDECLVLGADTIVAFGNQILGKPVDEADAVRMIELLGGHEHQVYTGVTVVRMDGDMVNHITFAECTEVSVYDIDHEEAMAYVATGEPMDKAGAYGIQGTFCKYIRKIDGDYNNVVGLPVGRIYQELHKIGWID